VEGMGMPNPPPAANDDFLEQATGGTLPANRTGPGNVGVRRGADPPRGGAP